MTSALFVGDALEWVAANFGLSFVGLLMLLVALEIWRGKKVAGRAANWTTYVLVVLVAIGALNLLGVLPTIRFDRAVEIVTTAIDWLLGAIPW